MSGSATAVLLTRMRQPHEPPAQGTEDQGDDTADRGGHRPGANTEVNLEQDAQQMQHRKQPKENARYPQTNNLPGDGWQGWAFGAVWEERPIAALLKSSYPPSRW